jgi:hypothetical protein
MNTKHFLVGLILTLTLAGCARSVVPSPIATPAPSPLATPPAVSEISITYQRNGGLMGVHDTWMINPQGKVSSPGSGATVQLTSAQMAELIAAIRLANFTALQDSYLPQDTCCDRYEYTVTITVDGRSKTVRTIDASPTAPPALTQLINTLTRLVTVPAPIGQ